MDTEDAVYVYNRVLAIKRIKSAICNNMDGLGEYYAKGNRSYREPSPETREGRALRQSTEAGEAGFVTVGKSSVFSDK